MKGQYIRIINHEGFYPKINTSGARDRALLNFTELEAYSTTIGLFTDVARSKPTSMSSSPLTYGSVVYGASNGVDGNYTLTNFVHSTETSATTTPVWWMVDLAGEYDIDVIRLVNRRDCCQERLLGFCIEILDNQRQVVYTSDIIAVVNVAYEFFPPDKTVLSIKATGDGYFYTNWSPWSACSTTCGSGQKTRSRGVVPDPKGAKPDTLDPLTESVPCNTDACPTAFTTWSDWTTCTATSCGTTGTTSRTRRVVADVVGKLGVATDADLVETKPCSALSCPIQTGTENLMTGLSAVPSSLFGKVSGIGPFAIAGISVCFVIFVIILCYFL